MPWYAYLLVFIAGAFAANGAPHFVQGICGNSFQTPFASPPAIGDSTAVVNVVWGWANFVIAGALLHFSLPPDWPPPLSLCAIAALGALAIALWLAAHFGKVRQQAPKP